eukprot:TRINITY_DN6139_c0_g2_i1.p4 TRINITY_DN6139_c0_g2~~TRINITY_DN6139_c0_g2_i1.p4  ORF type:complete len:126 (-),score=36.78 TRINITY_DN6139_c0_g2_i1:170-547(-)
MLESLLDHGADIDGTISSTEGLSFLLYFCGMKTELSAVQNQLLLEAIKFLLEHGADRNKKNGEGRNAFELAEESPQKNKVMELLENVEQKHWHKKSELKRVKRVDLDDAEVVVKEKGNDCKCLVL